MTKLMDIALRNQIFATYEDRTEPSIEPKTATPSAGRIPDHWFDAVSTLWGEWALNTKQAAIEKTNSMGLDSGLGNQQADAGPEIMAVGVLQRPVPYWLVQRPWGPEPRITEMERYWVEAENDRLNAAARREREEKALADKHQRLQNQGLIPKIHSALPNNAISAMDTEPWRMGWAREE